MAFTTRSEPARTAILNAARQRFGRDGYELTTIRSIAADAGVDPAMVMRYYQNKEGLFSAAVDIDLQLPDVTGIPVSQAARLLAGHFVNRWEGDLADEAIIILLRSAVTNPAAAERMRSVFAHQVIHLARAVTHNSPGSELRAAMVSTQVLGIALSRYILRLSPVAEMPPEDLIDVMTPVLSYFLDPTTTALTHQPSPTAPPTIGSDGVVPSPA